MIDLKYADIEKGNHYVKDFKNNCEAFKSKYLIIYNVFCI